MQRPRIGRERSAWAHLSASNGYVLLQLSGSSGWIRTESNRWNPLADVAELVNALVSGSRARQ